MNKIIALIVTYNRKQLLAACVCRLLDQSRRPDQILIIDNASTDGTESHLDVQGFLAHSLIQYHRLPDNVGGAGGFAEGIKQALQNGADWIWLMDDDAMPALDALEKLLYLPLDESCVYGSVAVGEDGEHLCWPVETHSGQKLLSLADLNEARTAPWPSILFWAF